MYTVNTLPTELFSPLITCTIVLYWDFYIKYGVDTHVQVAWFVEHLYGNPEATCFIPIAVKFYWFNVVFNIIIQEYCRTDINKIPYLCVYMCTCIFDI